MASQVVDRSDSAVLDGVPATSPARTGSHACGSPEAPPADSPTAGAAVTVDPGPCCGDGAVSDSVLTG